MVRDVAAQFITDMRTICLSSRAVVQRVFSDKSHFQLCPDDNRGRVWRSPGQRADPAFTIARHPNPQPKVIVCGTISFDSRTPLWLLEHTYSIVVRRRHYENCFATVPLAAPWPHFSAK
ncbi:hypothetical protein TNCV_2661651 [Trichonephila clavipes]|nr:hypothetical protein TNCV_2661651 [Trichonephila clavipes]